MQIVLWDSMKNLFVFIFIALTLGFLVTIFYWPLQIIFDLDLALETVFRWTFSAEVVLGLLIEIYWFYCNILNVKRLAKKLGVAEEDIVDGIFVFEIRNIARLGRENFLQTLVTQRMIRETGRRLCAD